MFYKDHPPPHFHVRCGEQRGLVEIESMSLLKGNLSPTRTVTNCGRIGIEQSDKSPSKELLPWSSDLLKDIIQVTPLEGFGLRLRFEDGVEGEVDLQKLIRFEGVFAALRTRDEFEKVRVDAELGTICWPNGADIDPDVLYARVTGQPAPHPGRASVQAD